MSTLNPKCLNGKDLGYSITGHIAPCCWTTTDWNTPYFKDLFSPELHIDNNQTVEDILNSKPWNIFFDMLKNNPNNAPVCCWKNCSLPLNEDTEKTSPEEWLKNNND